MSEREDRNRELFVRGYISCLLWASTDEVDGETVNLDQYSLSEEGKKKAEAECDAFLKVAGEVLASTIKRERDSFNDYNMLDAGHDFFLTRNGHGAGFWDRNLGDAGETLSELAREMGETYYFIEDCIVE